MADDTTAGTTIRSSPLLDPSEQAIIRVFCLMVNAYCLKQRLPEITSDMCRKKALVCNSLKKNAVVR